MLSADATNAALHTAAAVVGTASVVTTITGPTVPGLGVAVSTLLAANAGALVGLAYANPDQWSGFRKSLANESGAVRSVIGLLANAVGLAFTLEAIAITASWAITTLPHVPFFSWTATLPPMPAAGLLAAGGQFWFPVALLAGKRWIESRATR